MRRTSKHSQFKKTPAGESGSATSTPLPDPGAVNSDPAGAIYMTYAEQLKSPKWQKKRLEILMRDNFTCKNCGAKDKQFHVHHLFYRSNTKIWDYYDIELLTLCEDCHKKYHILVNDIHGSMLNILVNNIDKKFTLEDIDKILGVLATDSNFMSKLLVKVNNWKFDSFFDNINQFDNE